MLPRSVRTPDPGPQDAYASIADFYDLEHDPHRVDEADVRGYLRRGVAGPVLVLGCGTGRVCRALAAVRRVTGLDLSEPMLARARAHGGATRYVCGDMRDFDLGVDAFTEVIVPNGAFAFLPTRRDQTRALVAIHRALAPQGVLTLDLPMPDFRLLANPHSPEQRAWQCLDGEGRHIERTREAFREPVRARLRLIDRYYVDGVLTATTTLALRLCFPHEIEWMLESCGFVVEDLFGDHADNPLREGCPRLLVRAMRL